MKLKVKDVDLSSGGPLIAIINEKDANRLDLHALDRIKIKKGKKQAVVAINIAESSKSIKKGQIGLFEEVLNKLKLKNKEIVEIHPEPKPRSLDLIKNKLNRKKLNKKEINQIVKDIVENKLTETELTYFIAASQINGLTSKETTYLTEAIVKNSSILNLNKKIIFDKHCTGGLPNNRTTMLIVPIIASLGYVIPKTSSKAITSAAGTADTMEALAKVDFTKEEIEKIVKKTNGCIAWAGSIDLASADDKLIKLRNTLSLDPKGLLISSVLAKKAAVKATNVLIDIPVGKTTKIKSKKEALALKRQFIQIGKKLGMKIRVLISNGSQPIGNGIGPNLEARDILYILKRDKRAPKDLEKKAIKMAVMLLKTAKIKNPYKKVIYSLNSGLADKKMKEIIKAQEGNPNIKPESLKLGKFRFNFKAYKTGTICKINNNLLAKIARIAGSPQDKEAGIYLRCKLKQKVKKGQILFTIYSKSKERLEFAKRIINQKVVTII